LIQIDDLCEVLEKYKGGNTSGEADCMDNTKSRARAAEDIPFLGRTPGMRIAGIVAIGCAVVAGGIALSVVRDSEFPMILAIISVFVCLPLSLALPAWLSMRREQWIVLHGAHIRARVVACDEVGRAGPNMYYAIARIMMNVEVSGGFPVGASVRRVIYSMDRRDIAQLVGREFYVYWHESQPGLAVPEELL